MKYVLMYETAEDGRAKAPLHFPAHRALWEGYRARGELGPIGPFSDRQGAMAIFNSREAAEAFAAEDPFVLNGVIGRWLIREWDAE